MEHPSVGMSHSPGGSIPADPGLLFPTLGMGPKAELQLPGCGSCLLQPLEGGLWEKLALPSGMSCWSGCFQGQVHPA